MLLCAIPIADGASSGYVASTIGLTAVAYGIQALNLYRRGLGGGRDAARVGIAFGVISTLVMVYFMASFYLPSWGVTPSAASLAPPFMEVTQPPASVIDPVVAPPAYATEEGERMALAQELGTLSYVIGQTAPGGLVPDAVTVDQSDGTVFTSTGQILGRVDLGAQLSYVVSQDRTNYSLEAVGAQFGSVVTFDSLSGTVLTKQAG